MEWKLMPKEPTREMRAAFRKHGIPLSAGLWSDVLSAAPEPPQQMTWRPIETAPRDGTAVLAWNKSSGYWVAALRLPMRGEPQNESHYVHEWRDGGGRWAKPTHWMPIPAPPTEPT